MYGHKLTLKNFKINWICLKDKCPKNCCGKFYSAKTNCKQSVFGISEKLIPLTPYDQKILLKKKHQEFLTKEKDCSWYIKTKRNGNCPFLKNGLCSIYSIRPSSCRAYPFFFNKYNGLVIDLNCPGWKKGWTDIKEIKKMLKNLINVYCWQIKKIKKMLK